MGLVWSLIPASSQAQRSVVIGQVVDQQGGDLESSRDYVLGAKLCFDAVNSQGGIAGSHLVQEIRDSGGDAAKALSLSRDLIDKDNAVVLFGTTGEAAISAQANADLLIRSGIALVSPLTGLPQAGAKGGANLFVSRATYGLEVRKILEYFHTVSLSQFAVLATRRDLAAALMPQITAAVTNANAHTDPKAGNPMKILVQAEAFDPQALSGALKQIEASAPQVLIVLGDGLDVGLVASALATDHAPIPLVALSLANGRVVQQFAGQRAAEGIMISQVVPNPANADTPAAREHLSLMKRYLDEPPTFLTFEGFLAAKGLVEVLKQAASHGGIERANVLRVLKSRPQYDVGGVVINYALGDLPLSAVDLTMLRADGSLMN